MLKPLVVAFSCVLATACAAGPTKDVRQMQRAQYAIDGTTASILVRQSLDDYPIIAKGNGRFETRWLRGRDGKVYKLAVRIDGPGGGPFMVKVDAKLREKDGAIIEHDIPAWLENERQRLVVDIYQHMKPTEVTEEPPATVAGR